MNKNSVTLTLQAAKDLEEILLYIAEDNIKAAEKTISLFEQAFVKLANNPYIGSKREDLTDKSVRFWIVQSYYIIYSQDSNPLQILRIISAYRDIKNN
jgi:plasmid stabilization system protein ParE